MAIATPCTYQSVTLQPGESYVLPPGAEIVSATDSGSITSVNDCANLNNIETPVCYGIVFVSATGVDGTESETFENTQITFYGINVNGVYYPFATPVGFNGPDIQNQIEALSVGSLFSGFCVSSNADPSRQSLKGYLMFLVVPSVGDNLEIVGSTVAPNTGAGLPQAFFHFPAETRDDIIAAGHAGVCDCVTP